MPRVPPLLVAIFMLAGVLRGEDSQTAPTAGMETDFASRYVWEGIAYSRGPVFQPYVWAEYKGFTLSVWANEKLNNEPDRGRITEMTSTIERPFDVKGWTITPSYEGWLTLVDGADGGPNTIQGKVRIAHPVGRVTLYTDQAFDLRSYVGAYLGNAGMIWEKKVRRTTLNVTTDCAWASAKFNRTYFGPSNSAFNRVGSEFSVTIATSAHTYLRPHFQWMSLVDSRLRDSVSSPDLWDAGIAVGYNF